MVAIKLPVFSGMVPAIDKHLLADTNADYSKNAWLYSGALAGTPAKARIKALSNPLATIAYRAIGAGDDPSYLYETTWVEFENFETDFISAPVVGDTFNRYYWASTSQVPVYNTHERIAANQPPWLLGVPQPGLISVSPAGGASTTIVTRAYLTTLVTEYGEEGPASTPVVVSGKVDATYAVTVAAVPANDRGVDRNVKFIRIYRTITSSAGTATYYRVAELVATGASQVYNDTMLDTTLSSSTILESTAWSGPPNLNGFAVMPNGIVAGFRGNELYFSEAYRPHAWPAAYSLALEHDIVGLGVVNQTLVVCTNGNPVTASGVNPASITTSKLAAFEPCVSKGSIISTEEGVYYASPNGLILVNAGYAQNITRQYISRDQWTAIVERGKINACRLGSAYYAYGTGLPRAFQKNAFQNDAFQMEENLGVNDGFLIDPTNANVGFTYLEDTHPIKSVSNDAASGEVLLVKNGSIYWIDQRLGYTQEPYVWKSKVFQTPILQNFAAFRVYMYPYNDDEWVFPNPPNYNINQTFNPATQLAIVRVYADGKLILTHEVRNSGELHRLPSGFKAEFWQVEFEAKVKIKSFQMATSVKELAVA